MMDSTTDLECTGAFLFALWAFATGHWIVGIIALLFLAVRACW